MRLTNSIKLHRNPEILLILQMLAGTNLIPRFLGWLISLHELTLCLLNERYSYATQLA